EGDAARRRLEGLRGGPMGLVEDRRGGGAMFVIDRQQVCPVAGHRIALRLADRLFVLLEPLHERGVEDLDQWNVEPVEPEYRLIGFVAVIVPGHVGRNNKVAGCIGVRSPLTVVCAPLPSSTNRSADCEWRVGG